MPGSAEPRTQNRIQKKRPVEKQEIPIYTLLKYHVNTRHLQEIKNYFTEPTSQYLDVFPSVSKASSCNGVN